MLSFVQPMRLATVREPFDHPDWLYEIKWDGFRALAYIDGHQCRLVSRRGHVYKSWPYLATELAHAMRCDSAVLDGEIVCLQPDGRSHFYNLMFRREWPHFMAFDLLWLNGKDVRNLPLEQRKRRLARIMPRMPSRVRLVEHVQGCGVEFFNVACQNDVEGIVAKWAKGTYQSGARTSWLKVRNPDYTQWTGRRELFDARRDRSAQTRSVRPEFGLTERVPVQTNCFVRCHPIANHQELLKLRVHRAIDDMSGVMMRCFRMRQEPTPDLLAPGVPRTRRDRLSESARSGRS